MTNKVPCPFCGEEIEQNSKSCKFCGSDDETGWLNNPESTNTFALDDGFDYDDMLEREFPSKAPLSSGKNKKAFFFKIISSVLLGTFILFVLIRLL